MTGRSADIRNYQTQCQQDQERRHPNSRPCEVLFQLSLVENDMEAWTAICEIFTPRVRGWVVRYSRFEMTGEDPEVFVNEAFARFWQYGSRHAKKGKFARIGDYLQYLKRCVWTAIEDHLRKLKRDALWAQSGVDLRYLSSSGNLDDRVMISEILDTLWQLTQGNRKERIIAEETWVYGLMPRHIYAKFPDLFDSVSEISQGKKNLIRRLRRHPRINGNHYYSPK